LDLEIRAANVKTFEIKNNTFAAIMKRLFLAIKIIPDDNFLAVYYRLLKYFEQEKISWVPPENMHITLKFFGDTDEDKIMDIVHLIEKVSKPFYSFQFNLKDIGVFGSSYKPRVIWFGSDNAEPVKLLTDNLNKQLETIGYENDRQNFVPHLTVGRIRELNHKRSFQEKINLFKGHFIQQVNVEEIILFESNLTKTGAIYVAVERFPLR